MVYEQENRSLPCRPSKPTLGVPLRENRVNTFGRELSPTCSSKCSSANSDAFSMLSADLSTVCSSPPPSSSDAQISPDAKNARMRVPSLDVIAARLHKFEGYQTNEEAPSASPAMDKRKTPGDPRGRDEAIASLRKRAADRSRSASPTKAAFESPTMGPSSPSLLSSKDVPSLQDIVKRLGQRKDVALADSPCKQFGKTSLSESTSSKMSNDALSCSKSPTKLSKSVGTDAQSPFKAQTKALALHEARKAEWKNKPDKHPLEHVWAIYYDSKHGTVSEAATQSAHSFEAALRMIGQYHSVECFMSVFRTLRRPSQLERNCNYHLFKDGIKPMWEDPANAMGGKWVLTLRGANTALVDRSWMWLVFALIGEDLDEADDVTGAVISSRSKGDRITLWIRSMSDVTKVNRIGKRFVSLLDLEKEPGVSMEFSPNNFGEGFSSSSSLHPYYSFNNPLPSTASGSSPQSTALLIPAHSKDSLTASPNSLMASPTRKSFASARLNASPSKPGSKSPFLSQSRRVHDLQSKNSLQRGADSPSANVGLGFSLGLGSHIGRSGSPNLHSQSLPFGGLLNKNKIGTST